MLRQRVYGITAGNEDLNDHNELRNDELLQTVYGPDKVRHICGLFEILVDISIRNNYYHIENKLNLLKIKNYIRNHISGRISVAEVAAYLNCSTSTLLHFVKRHLE